MNKVIPAEWILTEDGIPFSNTFADIYHSADGGLGQAQHVFLGGNRLPERWRGHAVFTIIETGFGLGLNFLTTWHAFQADAHRPNRLHFVSVEKHPFSATDLEKLHKRWPILVPLSRELIRRWPPLIGGFHRLHFDNNRITLTLLFGDAAELLPQLEAQADAFFLDGFTPGKNPGLWSDWLFRELARLARPNATLATYTVASVVRDGLAAAGFSSAKAPGFGRKREMLVGVRNNGENPPRKHSADRAIIIGAGLAGTACAERLAARGWTVELIERHSLPAQAASGNPSAVLHPILHMAETANARLSRIAFLYAIRHMQSLDEEGHGIYWGKKGLLQIAAKTSGERLAQIIERHAFPPDLVRFVDANEATQLAGIHIAGAGCWFTHGAWVDPVSLCKANLQRHAGHIIRHMNTDALRLEKTPFDQWRVYGEDGSLIGEAPVMILANSIDCKAFQQTSRLPLESVRGQITYLPELSGKKLTVAITGDGYIAPQPAGGYCIGATFQHNDTEIAPRLADHAENLARLELLLPGFAAGLDPNILQGRVAWRTTTPDRLPVFGALQSGLYAATGLGARGLIWAPLGAELLAAQIGDEPLPIEHELAAAISPARFKA